MKNKTVLITNIPSHYRQEIFQKLSNIGVDFIFSDEETTISRLDFHSLRSQVIIGKYIRLLGGMNFLSRSICESLKYRNVIVTGDFRSLHVWFILFFSLLTRQRVYLWGHSWYGREGRVKKFIKRVFFAPSYRILTYGNHARKLMIEEGYKSGKIIPIYNSLSYEHHLQLRKYIKASSPLSANLGTPYIIFVGRVNRNKKLPLLIDALKKVHFERGLVVKLLVIGEECDSGELRQHIKNIEMESYVELMGPIYDDVVLSTLIFSAAVCVSPGNVGLTAIHSLSFGTPVITHNNFKNQMPEFESIIPDKTGLFFEENNVDKLTSSIFELVNISPERRNVIRQECYQEIDRFWNTRYQIDVFRSILK